MLSDKIQFGFCKGAGDAGAFILSAKGLRLSNDERAFFQEANPLGFILFARNCEDREQLRGLTNDLRESVGRNCPILIDQEGGRVQRLKPPVWRSYPPMQYFGDMARTDMDGALEALRFTILQMSEELLEVGVNVDCAPVLDVLSALTHDVIGDRAFADDPDIVARLGVSVCRHFLAAGVTPVVKHIPGHGLGKVDSHKDLPCVDEAVSVLDDIHFDPFRSVFKSDVGASVWAMAAHIVYRDIDPDHPASVSRKVIDGIIRGNIGFDGFLVSDDLDMEALADYGDVAQRAVASIEAGCDAALYCAGELSAMEKIAKAVPKLSAKALERLQKAQNAANIAV